MKPPSMDDVKKHLLQLRATLVHALTQPNISPKRFNECRSQILPLDQQLRALGVEDLPFTAQMQPSFVKVTRHERRQRQRASKHSPYEQRVQSKLAAKRGREDVDD